MATTAQQVFDMALALADCVGENSDYSNRILPTLNNIMPELYIYSTGVTATAGEKPTPPLLTSLAEYVPVDDVLARAVLPHAVIAVLLLGDDDARASYHEQKYFERLAGLSRTPAATEDIENIYGALGVNEGYIYEDAE